MANEYNLKSKLYITKLYLFLQSWRVIRVNQIQTCYVIQKKLLRSTLLVGYSLMVKLY